jgi:hypothetical protein
MRGTTPEFAIDHPTNYFWTKAAEIESFARIPPEPLLQPPFETQQPWSRRQIVFLEKHGMSSRIRQQPHDPDFADLS